MLTLMIIPDARALAVFRPEKMGKADLFGGDQLFAGLNCFEPGQKHDLHAHAGQDKMYYVIEGEGLLTVGDETVWVGPGAAALARDGVPHAVENTGAGRLVVMAVMAPPPGRRS